MNTMIIDSTTAEDNHDDSNDNDNAIFIYYVNIYVHPPQSRIHAFQVMTYVLCIHRFYPTYYMVTNIHKCVF